MPIIEINLVPPKTNQKALRALCEDLFEVVANIPELRLTNKDTTVLLPTDMLGWGVGSELIIWVKGLVQKPERTQAVIDRLLAAIGQRIERFALDYVPQCTKIEVLHQPYEQADGLWKVDLPDNPDMIPLSLVEACTRALDLHRSTGEKAAVCKHPSGGYFACYYEQRGKWELVCVADAACEDAQDVYRLAEQNLALEYY